MKTLPVALQVYSVRDYASKDFAAAMKKIKEIGYDYVELASTYGLDAAATKKALDEAGLKAVSAHVSFGEFGDDIEGTVIKYKEIGCKYIAIPYLAEGERPGDEKFGDILAKMLEVGEACKKHGLVMLYHNHDFEFKRMVDGRYGIDYLYDTIGPDLLQTELDTCWVNVGGENPAQYIRKYANRCPVVHLKDFIGAKSANMYELIGIKTEKKEEDDVKFEFRPVGKGKQNFPEILEASVESGALYVVVEQDQSYEQDCMEACKDSRDYLKSLNW